LLLFFWHVRSLSAVADLPAAGNGSVKGQGVPACQAAGIVVEAGIKFERRVQGFAVSSLLAPAS
jgi:hypothetical protein